MHTGILVSLYIKKNSTASTHDMSHTHESKVLGNTWENIKDDLCRKLRLKFKRWW